MIEIELKSNELKEYVYLKLNKDRNMPLYDNDLEKIDYVPLNGLDFLSEPTDVTLYDLVFFSNLKKCIIMNKEISVKELQILEKCKNLKTLQLTHCTLPKDAVIKLGVESLIVDGCRGVEVTNFDNIDSVKKLRIVNCEIADVKGISKFNNITDLYLQNLLLNEIDEVNELKNLQYLNLNGTTVKKKYKFDNKFKIVHEDINCIYDN